MRTFEEINADLDHAFDTESMLRYAAELDDLRTPIAETAGHVIRGNADMLRGDHLEALEYYHRALALTEELNDRNNLAVVTGNIGNVYSDTGDYPVALEYYHRALAIHQELGHRSDVARVMANIGSVHRLTSDYPAALEHYHRALALLEELGDHGGVARVMGNIGSVLVMTGDYPAGLEYYHRALAMHEELGQRSGVAGVTGNIGNVHLLTGDYPAALEHYHRALAMHDEIGDRRSAAQVTVNIVSAHVKMGSDADAQALLLTMDAMQIDEPQVRIEREINRAELQERSGDLDGAVVTLQRALDEGLEHGLRSVAASAHKALRDLAQNRNDLASYIEHNNEYTRITDEINGKETTTKLAMQEAERKMAKVQSEHEKHLAVLHSTLPKHIADRVARGETVTDQIDNAAVMFVDIVGFTTLSSTLSGEQVTTLLDGVFGICDEACKQYNVTRIKTIGDSYLAVAFPSLVPSSSSESLQVSSSDLSLVPRDDSAYLSCVNIANSALEIITQLKSDERACLPDGGGIQVRIGLHCGPITAGVLGKERLQYDVWGDTVNIASRMESSGEPGRVHVTEQFANALSPLSAKERGLGESSPETAEERGLGESSRVEEGVPLGESSLMLELRGETEIKGKGTMQTFWLSRNA